MEFTTTTVKKDFIFKIINDEICVPSKEMRKIFNDDWPHVTSYEIYNLITLSMHPMATKIKMLTNLSKFVNDEFRTKIKAYITCRKYEYSLIKKKSSKGMKFVYNVYSMSYHKPHSNRCFEEMSNCQGQCNMFIGTANSVDSARAMIILDHEGYRAYEEETHDPYYNLYYMVSKTLLFDEKCNDLDCSYGDLYFDKNGNIIDIFIYDFRIDEDYNKYPIIELEDDVGPIHDNGVSKINGIDKFTKDKKVKIHNSLYTRGLCDATEKYGYIIGYLDKTISNPYCSLRDSNRKDAKHDAMPIQYIDIVRKDD